MFIQYVCMYECMYVRVYVCMFVCAFNMRKVSEILTCIPLRKCGLV